MKFHVIRHVEKLAVEKKVGRYILGLNKLLKSNYIEDNHLLQNYTNKLNWKYEWKRDVWIYIYTYIVSWRKRIYIRAILNTIEHQQDNFLLLFGVFPLAKWIVAPTFWPRPSKIPLVARILKLDYRRPIERNADQHQGKQPTTFVQKLTCWRSKHDAVTRTRSCFIKLGIFQKFLILSSNIIEIRKMLTWNTFWRIDFRKVDR